MQGAPAPSPTQQISGESVEVYPAAEPPKPGIQSTEFWLTLVNKSAGLGVLFIGVWRREPETMMLGAGLAGLSIGTYNISRGLAKKQA